jgi:hypothetical protein
VKVSDHTMTIMTGLVLTVVVGMLAQNSESIMASFTGQNRIVLQDDAFTVRAGKPQVIDILLNDQVPPKTDLSKITLVDMPACGKLEVNEGKYRFVDSDACAGPVSFTYCHADDAKCTLANVNLQILPKPGGDPVVASAPQVRTGTLPQATEPVQQPVVATLETPPAIAEPAPETAVAAVESLNGPAPDQALAQTEVISALPDMPGNTGFGTDSGFTEADTSTTLIAEAPADPESQPSRPDPDDVLLTANPPAPATAEPSPSEVTVALAEVAPQVTLPSPAPEPACSVGMTAEPAAGGMVAVALETTCQPDTPFILRQGAFEIAVRTDAAGRFAGAVPAFARDVEIEAILPDGITRKAEVVQPDADRFMRVAVLWKGDVDLDLRAGEFGAGPGQPGYVWSGDPRDWRQARLSGGGYLETFGTPSGAAEVYSLPVSRRQPEGVVDLSLHVADGRLACDKDVDLRVLRFEGGASRSSQVRFTMAPCGETLDEYEVVNALSDLRVAAR